MPGCAVGQGAHGPEIRAVECRPCQASGWNYLDEGFGRKEKMVLRTCLGYGGTPVGRLPFFYHQLSETVLFI